MGMFNIFNVARNSSALLIVASGQMLVLVVGGFDLSVGAVIALTSVVTAKVMAVMLEGAPEDVTLAIIAGVAAGMGCGFVTGLINGACVAFLRISPFMVTLGTSSIATGVALLLTNGIPVYGMPDAFVKDFGRAIWFGLPMPVYVSLSILVLVWIMQRRTTVGRYIHAIGGNVQAAMVSGVNTNFYLILAYTLCGMLASLTSLLLTARLGSGQATMSGNLMLESIAAGVIAGVSLRGGVGRVEMVALSALFLSILTNAMNLLKVNSKIQTIFMGIIVVAAVALDELAKRRSRSAREG
ncbi:MAG: ABC transporter permease [Burkholderiales bacterium]|nr:ABC transporter permease [Burkholderiales bacterium]